MKKNFCSIIGYPLPNPRSIKIWKSFFLKNKLNYDMHKMEIKNLDFKQGIKKIFSSNFFKATLITMPYKKKILKYVNEIDSSAKISGTANLIIKKKQNSFRAYNTDVIAAYEILKNKINKYNTIAIIGLGGTGLAIFKYFSKLKPDIDYILISSKKKINAGKQVKFVLRKSLNLNIIKQKLIIINATPLGSDLAIEFQNKTPITKNLMNNMNKQSLVFDVVYSPKNTKLSYLCKINKIKYISGIKMNTLQGKIALSYVF